MWREGKEEGCEGQPKGELLFPVYRGSTCLTPVFGS